MTLQEQKMACFEEVVIGESIHLSEMNTILGDCSFFHYSVELSNNDIFVKHLAGTDSEEGALVVSLDQAPRRTTRRSSQLISEFKKKHCPDHELSKLLLAEIFQKRSYLCAYMTACSVWVPLEGEYKRDVDYANLASLKSIRRLPGHETMLCFVNHLEVRVPQDFYTVQKKITKYMQRYIAVSWALSQLNYQAEEVKFFSKWRECCGYVEEELLQEVMPKINLDQLRYTKSLYDLTRHTTCEESRQILVDIYESV